MKSKQLKYVKIESDGADKVMRWNACQIISKQLYKSTQKTAEIVEVARESFERKIDVKISLKK